MSDILCRWLNEELRLSRIVEPKTFAKDFSSGYLIGEVLHKYNLQSDFSLFMKKDTSVSKLNNFTRLEPTLRLLRISFDTNTARDLIEEKQGVASHLLYQLYVSLEKNRKADISRTMMETMQPVASAGLLKKEHEIFTQRLHQVVKRDAELQLQKITKHYEQRVQQTISRPMENQSIPQRKPLRVQDERKKNADKMYYPKHNEERFNRVANYQVPKPPAKCPSQAQLKKKQQLLQRKERQAEVEMVQAEIAQFETHRKKLATSSFASSLSAGGQPLSTHYHVGASKKALEVSGGERKLTLQSNSKYIQEIRQRLEDNANASERREKRRDRFLMEQLKAHEAQEEAKREEQMIKRFTRQTRQEQRLANQLLQLRMQKDVIRENRLFREQQYQQRREKDFQEALDREAALAQQAKLDQAEDIRKQVELCKRMAAEKAQSRHMKHFHICADILEQILDLATKIGEYRMVTQNLIPEKQMREWKELLFNGLPLYEPIKGHQQDTFTSLDPIENEKQVILNNQDYDDYTNFKGDWTWSDESGETKSPPLNNDILGHIIQKLRTDLHPPILKMHSSLFPPFAIKACVLSKFRTGNATCLTKVAEELNIHILSTDSLVEDALNAYKKERLSQMQSDGGVTEQQGEHDNQQLLTVMNSDVEKQRERGCNTNLSSRAMTGAAAEKELKEGNTVPDELLVDIIVAALRELPAHSGWILDGFPLDMTQVHLLEKALGGLVDGENENKDQRMNLAADPNPPKPPSPPAPALDLALLLDFPDDQVFTNAFGLMEEETRGAKTSPLTPWPLVMAQLPHRITAFKEVFPELEEWFGQQQNILVRVEVNVVDEEFCSQVKSVLQQVMQKRSKDLVSSPEAVPETTDSAQTSSATSGDQQHPALTEEEPTSTDSLSNLKDENVQSPPSMPNAHSLTGHSENSSTTSLREKGSSVNIQSESAASIPASHCHVFADKPLHPEMSKYLCPYWDMVCHSYVNNVKTVMEQLRCQRANFNQHIHMIRERYKHFLGRPDLKQELVTQWQKEFNIVPDDMRDDEDNKSELHLRLDGLRERLWDISDKRKEEDEQERASLKNDGWLEDHVSIVINLHSLLMQVELDRFQATCYILMIYYCSMYGKTRPQPPSKMYYIPLINAKDVNSLNEREESRPPSGSVVHSETDEEKEIEFVPLVSGAVTSTEPVQMTHEKLISDYDCAITAISDLVAVDTQRMKGEPIEKEQEKKKTAPGSASRKKEGKPSKKEKGFQSPTAANSPAPDEGLNTSQDQKGGDKIQQEYAAVLQHEESAAKVRIALVKGHGLVMTRALQSRADECFASMEKSLQECYLAEMRSVDKLSEVVRHNIEAGTKLQTELVLECCDFYLNGDSCVVESPPPPLRPAPLEKPTSSTLTIVQLESLHQQLYRMAPSGLIYSHDFLCFVKDFRLIRRGQNSVFEQWIESTETQWRDVVFLLSDDDGLVDWRQFLLCAALPWPHPSLTQLLELLQKFKALDTSECNYITEEQYLQTDMWFSGDCTLVVPEDPAEPVPYDRLANLRRLFAEHEDSPPKLDYMHMLLYFASDSNPRKGFIRALSLVLGRHLKPSSSSSHLVMSMPSIQEAAELTVSDLDGNHRAEPLSVSSPFEADPEVSIADLLSVICHKVIRIKHPDYKNQEKQTEHLVQIFTELELDPQGRVSFSVLSQHPLTQMLMEKSKQYHLINIHRVLQTSQGEEEGDPG